MPPFTFACPQCHALLDTSTPNLWRCPAGHGPYPLEDGIWRCLTPAQSSYYAQFVQEYETVRRAEGWGSPSAAYYRALPYPGRDDPTPPSGTSAPAATKPCSAASWPAGHPSASWTWVRATAGSAIAWPRPATTSWPSTSWSIP